MGLWSTCKDATSVGLTSRRSSECCITSKYSHCSTSNMKRQFCRDSGGVGPEYQVHSSAKNPSALKKHWTLLYWQLVFWSHCHFTQDFCMGVEIRRCYHTCNLTGSTERNLIWSNKKTRKTNGHCLLQLYRLPCADKDDSVQYTVDWG